MAKVSDVKVPSTGRHLGQFHIGRFNLFDDEDVRRYEELRTQGNDRSSGITIEHVQQFTRVVTETESTESGEVTSRREDLYVLVQWWAAPVVSKAKEHTLGNQEPARDWFMEREGSTEKS